MADKPDKPRREKAPEAITTRIGAPPIDDSLGAISWMQRALAEMAHQVVTDKRLGQAEKREELLKIADRMAKLRDPDRIYQAEQRLLGADQQMTDTTRGPQLTDAPKPDQQARPVAARRGRPPRSAIR